VTGELVRTWAEISARLGRNELPAALFDAYYGGAFGDTVEGLRELGKAVEDAWTGAEFPLLCVPLEIWANWFQSVGVIIDDGSPVPTESFQVYRAAARKHKLGLSWTDDLDRAKWFLNRNENVFGFRSGLYTAIAHPEDVLARFTRARGESEWVLDARRLDIRPVPTK
jgi:hypothetical protein